MTDERFARDFLDEFEKITQILDPGKRSLSSKQRSLILEQRLNTMIHNFNRLSSSKELEIEEKSKLMEDGLHKMSQLLHSGKKPDLVDSYSWYKLHMLRNFFITSLMDFWGEGGVLRIVGMANALANILMGIEVIDISNLLVNKDHPEFFKRYTLAFNYLNHTASLFYSACCSLYNISKEHLLEWGRYAIEGHAKLLSLIRKDWEITKWYARESQCADASRFYMHFATMIATLTQMLRYLISLTARFENDATKSLYRSLFSESETSEEFIRSIKNLLTELQGYIQDYKNHAHKGTFDINDNPLEMPMIKQVLDRVELIRLVIMGLSQTYNLTVKEEKTALDKLKSIVTDIFSFLETRETSLNDPKFVGSEYADYLSERLEYFIFFIGILGKYTPTWQLIDRLKSALGVFISEEAQKRYPKLYGLYLTAILTLASKVQDRERMLQSADQLVAHSPLLPFQPRDEFAMYFMGQLTRLALGKEPPEAVMTVLNEKLSNMRQFLSAELVTEIEEYLTCLQKAVKKEEVVFSISRLSSATPFDPFSMLTPDLAPYAQELGFKIIYIPFNLMTDYVK